MPTPGNRASILVVDDDTALREVLVEQLTMLGYEVSAAASAEAALASVERRAPDLILTDVHMGATSGIELCARLKVDPRFQLTPVILLTAVSDLEARVAGLAAGADDFFSKPFDFTELRTRVAALVRVKGLLGSSASSNGRRASSRHSD
jgi:DNA-binding response OmpR family regulator